MKSVDNTQRVLSGSLQNQSLICHICGQSVKSTLVYYNHLVKRHDKLELSLCILELSKLLTPQNETKTNASPLTEETEESVVSHLNGLSSTNENCIGSISVNQESSNLDKIAKIVTNLCPDVSTNLSGRGRTDTFLKPPDALSEDTLKFTDSASVEETIEYVIKCFGPENRDCSTVESNPVSPSQPISVSYNVDNHPTSLSGNHFTSDVIRNQDELQRVKEKNCSAVELDPSRPTSVSDNLKNPSSGSPKNPCTSVMVGNQDEPERTAFQIFPTEQSDISKTVDSSNKSLASDAIREPEIELFEGEMSTKTTRSCGKEIEGRSEHSGNSPETSANDDCGEFSEDQALFFNHLGLKKYESFSDSFSSTYKVPTDANALAEVESTKKLLYSKEESFNFRIPIKFFTENPLPEDFSIFEPLLSPLLGIPPQNKFSEEKNIDPVAEPNMPSQPPEKPDATRSELPCQDDSIESVTTPHEKVTLTSTLESPDAAVSDTRSTSQNLPENPTNDPIRNIAGISSTTSTLVKIKTAPQNQFIRLSDVGEPRIRVMRQEDLIRRFENGFSSETTSTPAVKVTESSEKNKFDANNFISLVSKLVTCNSSEQEQLGTSADHCSNVRSVENQTLVSCKEFKCISASNPACDNSLACKSVMSIDTPLKMRPETQVIGMKSAESGKSPNCHENFSDKIVRLLSEKQSLEASATSIRSEPASGGKHTVNAKLVASVDTQTEETEFKAGPCLTSDVPPLIPFSLNKDKSIQFNSKVKVTENSVSQSLQSKYTICSSEKANVPQSTQNRVISIMKKDNEISQNSKYNEGSEVSFSAETLKVSSSTSNSFIQGSDSQESKVKSNDSTPDNALPKGDLNVSSSEICREPNGMETAPMTCLPFLISANGVLWQVFQTQSNSQPVQILKPIQLSNFGGTVGSGQEKAGASESRQMPNLSMIDQQSNSDIKPRTQDLLLQKNSSLKSSKTKRKYGGPKVNRVKQKLVKMDNTTSMFVETSKAEDLKLPLNLSSKALPAILDKPDVNRVNSNSVNSDSLNNLSCLAASAIATVFPPVSMEEELKDGNTLCPSEDSSIVLNRQFYCNLCDKHYAKKNHLIRHVRMHMNDRPYKCDHCGKCFTTTSILKQHVRCHSGERPFVCPVCGKTFAQKSSLLTHSMLHNGKRFKCYFCRKAFVSNHKLQRHLKRHDAEDSGLYCCVCEFQFAVEGAFMEHLVLVHGYEKQVETKPTKKIRKVRKYASRRVPVNNVTAD